MVGKPNFFILGAPKCGTTSLVAWLSEHPNVYMSPWKEPRYFDRDLKTRFRIGEARYYSLFEEVTEEHLAVGEATVWYLYSQEAVPNIEQELPGAQYVVLVRNPVDMAYSLHEQMTLHQVEHIFDFAKAWKMGPLRRQGRGASRWLSEPRLLDYQSICCLGEQLERLFGLVSRERILVLLLDDLKKDPRGEYLKLLSFLGVPDDGRTEFEARNPAKRVRWRLFQRALVLAMKGERVSKGMLGLKPANSRVFWALNDLNKVPRPRAPLSPELKAQLQEFFAQDVEKLQHLLDRDLSAWLEPA